MKYAFPAMIFAFGLALCPDAHAQMAVIDSANLAQNVQTAAQSILAVEQLKAQLSQLEQTYSMFTTQTNVLGMASGLENSSLENPMPAANALSSLVGGTSTSSSAAQTYYNQNHIYSPTDGSSDSTRLNNSAQSIANIQGTATTNLASIETRLQELPELENQLQSATSITQVEAINGRIAAESQFVQAQQAQAANLQVLANEQQASQAQQAAEAHQEGENNLIQALDADSQ